MHQPEARLTLRQVREVVTREAVTREAVAREVVTAG